MPVKHLTAFDSLHIDQSPSRNASVTLSSHLPAKDANHPILNTVIVRLCNSLAAFVLKPQQLFAPHCGSQESVYFLINCHFNDSNDVAADTAFQYFLGRGGIRDTSTGSNSNFGSSASGAKHAFVVFIQFLSSRSGKSGL